MTDVPQLPGTARPLQAASFVRDWTVPLGAVLLLHPIGEELYNVNPFSRSGEGYIEAGRALIQLTAGERERLVSLLADSGLPHKLMAAFLPSPSTKINNTIVWHAQEFRDAAERERIWTNLGSPSSAVKELYLFFFLALLSQAEGASGKGAFLASPTLQASQAYAVRAVETYVPTLKDLRDAFVASALATSLETTVLQAGSSLGAVIGKGQTLRDQFASLLRPAMDALRSALRRAQEVTDYLHYAIGVVRELMATGTVPRAVERARLQDQAEGLQRYVNLVIHACDTDVPSLPLDIVDATILRDVFETTERYFATAPLPFRLVKMDDYAQLFEVQRLTNASVGRGDLLPLVLLVKRATRATQLAPNPEDFFLQDEMNATRGKLLTPLSKHERDLLGPAMDFSSIVSPLERLTSATSRLLMANTQLGGRDCKLTQLVPSAEIWLLALHHAPTLRVEMRRDAAGVWDRIEAAFVVNRTPESRALDTRFLTWEQTESLLVVPDPLLSLFLGQGRPDSGTPKGLHLELRLPRDEQGNLATFPLSASTTGAPAKGGVDTGPKQTIHALVPMAVPQHTTLTLHLRVDEKNVRKAVLKVEALALQAPGAMYRSHQLRNLGFERLPLARVTSPAYRRSLHELIVQLIQLVMSTPPHVAHAMSVRHEVISAILEAIATPYAQEIIQLIVRGSRVLKFIDRESVAGRRLLFSAEYSVWRELLIQSAMIRELADGDFTKALLADFFKRVDLDLAFEENVLSILHKGV